MEFRTFASSRRRNNRVSDDPIPDPPQGWRTLVVLLEQVSFHMKIAPTYKSESERCLECRFERMGDDGSILTLKGSPLARTLHHVSTGIDTTVSNCVYKRRELTCMQMLA